MKTLLIAASALALATAAGAQTPPVSSTTDSTTQPGPTDDMMTPPDASPMDEPMTDDDMMTPDDTADSVDEPTTREGVPPTTRPAPRVAPQPNPVRNPVPGQAGATQPTPRAAPAGTGPGEYPVCSATVTDRCVNPNDIRRGIAKRPTR